MQDSNNLIFDFSTIGTGYALAFTPFSKVLSYYGHVFILTSVLAFIIALVNEYRVKYSIILLYMFCIIFYKQNDEMNNTPKLMILPEGVTHEKINTNLDYIKSNYDYLIEGGEIIEADKKYNISKYYDFKKNITRINYKYFLFPLGEYIPLSALPYKYAMENNIGNIKLKIYSSKNENNLISIYDKKALVLLCADAWSYKSVSRFKDLRRDIDYVIVQRSDAIFNNSNLYRAQVELYKHVLSDYFRKPIIDITTYKYLNK